MHPMVTIKPGPYRTGEGLCSVCSTVDPPPRHVASQPVFRQGAGIRSRLSSAVRCTTTITWRIGLDVLNCAHFHRGLAHIVYSSASVGSTSYLVVYAEIASQVENRQGAGIREGAGSKVLYGAILIPVSMFPSSGYRSGLA